MGEHVVANGVDVGNVHLTVTIHVTSSLGTLAKDHIEQSIDVGNVHLTVTVHIVDVEVGLLTLHELVIQISTGELKANDSLAISYTLGERLGNNLGIHLAVELTILVLTIGQLDAQSLGNIVTIAGKVPTLVHAGHS